MTSKAARFITQLMAEIAERDARIAEQLREITQLRRELGIVQEVANSALKAQQPSAGVACALMSALEGIVHDQRVPNEVSQECAAVLIEARRLNPNPAGSGVVLPERGNENEGNSYSVMQAMAYNQALDEVARLNPCRAQAVPDGYVIMVPVNSTEAMRDAINLLCDDSSAFDDSEAFWRYLLAAAPSTKKESGDE